MRRVLIWAPVCLVLVACAGAPAPSDGTDSTAAVAEVSTTTTTTTTTNAAEDPAATIEAAPVSTTVAPLTTTTTAAFTTTTTPATTTTTAVTTTVPETNTTTLGPPDDDPPPIEGLGLDLSAQVRKTVEIVEEIRGLEFDGLPSITVLSPEDFTERVRSDVEAELENIEVDGALFKLLGLLEPDDDLAVLYGEFYSESVAGFYSSQDQEMVIPGSGSELSPLEVLTLLHELVHALTDQHFGFGPRIDDLTSDQLYDPAAGLVALVEGDATLAGVLYVQSLTASERNRLFAEIADLELPDFEVPLFMENGLYFPYERGFEYVWSLWTEGRWQGVNDKYLDPPLSTEEVYEGAEEPRDRPVEMERPTGTLPEGYKEIYDYTWGFLDILLMFEQVLGADAAVDAATGWGGGRSLVGYKEDGEVVFIWEYAGDHPDEARELASLLAEYAALGMDVGLPQSHGDLGFFASGEDYIFVGSIPSGLVIVACSDPEVCPSVAAPYRP